MEVFSKHLTTLSENLPAFRLENLRSFVKTKIYVSMKNLEDFFSKKNLVILKFFQIWLESFQSFFEKFDVVVENCILPVTRIS